MFSYLLFITQKITKVKVQQKKKKVKKDNKGLKKNHFRRSPSNIGAFVWDFILGNNHFFHLKKLIFVYLDNFLKINIISKKSVFSLFEEAEKSSFWKKKNQFSAFSTKYKF